MIEPNSTQGNPSTKYQRNSQPLRVHSSNVTSALHFVENQNGIYQGHLSRTQRKEGRGIFFWDSGELYYGD